MAPAFGFEMSFVVVLELATILFNSSSTPAFRVLPAEGPPPTLDIPPGDGYSREIEHFALAVAGETVEPIITPEQARHHPAGARREAAAREGRASRCNADFRGGAICLFRTHFLGWSGRF